MAKDGIIGNDTGSTLMATLEAWIPQVGEEVRWGRAQLRELAGVTERAVRKALVELIRAKLVKVVRKGRLGVGPSTYRVRGVNPDTAG